MGKRFSGWTMEAVNSLNGCTVTKATKQTKNRAPNYVGMISGALKALGVEHVTEYKFLHDRRFKYDICIPNIKIAIEFEGGIYKNGRHTRGKGYANDCKKYNLATMYGWKLLRYTSDDAKELNWEYRVAQEIKDFIENCGERLKNG